MSAMAQLSRGALSARPFAPLPKPASARSVHLKAAGSEQLWLPGTDRPRHLNGELPGDRGFDPLVRACLTLLGTVGRCVFREYRTSSAGCICAAKQESGPLFTCRGWVQSPTD